MYIHVAWTWGQFLQKTFHRWTIQKKTNQGNLEIFWGVFQYEDQLPWEKRKVEFQCQDANHFKRLSGKILFESARLWSGDFRWRKNLAFEWWIYRVFLRETLVVDFSYRVIYMTYMIYVTLNSLSDSRVQSMNHASFHETPIKLNQICFTLSSFHGKKTGFRSSPSKTSTGTWWVFRKKISGPTKIERLLWSWRTPVLLETEKCTCSFLFVSNNFIKFS